MADLVSYVIRKMLLAIPIMLLATLIVFLMLYLSPGDPITSLAPPHASVEELDEIRDKYGLNDPVYVCLLYTSPSPRDRS